MMTETTTLVVTTSITKIELFDEDIMRQMLVDDRIPADDKKKLSQYYKHRLTPGKTTVAYELHKNCVEEKVGRFYPVGGLGLSIFRRDIRAPLLNRYYWDVDIENCHYNIALKFAKDWGITHSAIERYCHHRAECLEAYSSDRRVAKNAYLKLAYGGDLGLYREDYEDVPGECKAEGQPFLRLLKQEMTTLAEMMWGRYPHLHKLKSGKENKTVEKRYNPRSVLMSLVFQTEEAKVLRVLDAYLASVGRIMGVLIHDGGCVEKLSGELEFPSELLVTAAEAIYKATGYNFTLTVKTLTHSYTAPSACADEYARMKVGFEKRNFLIGAILNKMTEDGVRLEYKMAEAKTVYGNLIVNQLDPKTMEMVKKPFLPMWVADPKRRDYERCDFIPNRAKCPEKVFNLFTGFVVEAEAKDEISENGEISTEEMMTLIAPILKHNEVLCDGDPSYFLKWQSNIIQNPETKSEVGCLFRDKGGLLFEGGGTGKNFYMDFFGRQILGDQYYICVDDNSILYGAFNSVFEGKLLVFVEETDGKDNHGNADKLKSKITKHKAPIKRKMIAEYEVNDYARWVFGTNGINPLPIKQGDRRMSVWDVCPTHRGNKAYFEALAEACDNRRVRVAFFQYLSTLDTYRKPIDFQLARPITEAYIDIRQINAPAHMKWLRHELRCGTLPAVSGSRELYVRFSDWYGKSKSREPERIVTETSFGKMMKEAYTSDEGKLEVAEWKHTRDGMTYRFDFKRLIEGLEKLHLLRAGECEVNAEGCLIDMNGEE